MMIRNRAALLVVLLLASGLTQCVHAVHPNHTTSARAEFNPKTNRLEVALRIVPEDLERALTKQNGGEKVDLEETENVDTLITEYLKTTFFVVPANADRKQHKQTIHWFGKEVSHQAALLYFEVPLQGGLDGAQISNRVLFDVNDEQVNTIGFRQKKFKTAIRFTTVRPWRTVDVRVKQSDHRQPAIRDQPS